MKLSKHHCLLLSFRSVTQSLVQDLVLAVKSLKHISSVLTTLSNLHFHTRELSRPTQSRLVANFALSLVQTRLLTLRPKNFLEKLLRKSKTNSHTRDKSKSPLSEKHVLLVSQNNRRYERFVRIYKRAYGRQQDKNHVENSTATTGWLTFPAT